MVILCGVCVWHSVVGAAATHYHVIADDETSPEVTSSPETTSLSANASARSTACPPATSRLAEIVMADRMALAMFGSLYLLFHVVFVARICASVCSHTLFMVALCNRADHYIFAL